MTYSYFIAFTIALIVALYSVLLYFPPRRTGGLLILSTTLWLTYVGVLSYSGVVANYASRPPGIFFVVAPAGAFALFLAISRSGGKLASYFPIWLLTGFQVFRIGVELLIHRLWVDGLVPKLMTYEAGNVDIFIGITAPVAAFLVTRPKWGKAAGIAWNIIGILALANIVTRAFLTYLGPNNILHSEIPNIAIGMFPYTYIAGFFAPLALVLHVLTLRSLVQKA